MDAPWTLAALPEHEGEPLGFVSRPGGSSGSNAIRKVGLVKGRDIRVKVVQDHADGWRAGEHVIRLFDRPTACMVAGVNVNRPNLFQFATSELSQDAVLCWLLAWADHRAAEHDAHLHEVGRAFLDGLFEAFSTPAPVGPVMVVPARQLDDADIVALVGTDHVVVIEDKTSTGDHSDQLRRYEAAVRARYPTRKVVLVYVKTRDQASYEEVRRKGWAVFTRRQLLGVLRPARVSVSSDVLTDFVDHLEKVEADVQSFRSMALDSWGRCGPAWTGLYEEVIRHLRQGSWDYVPNAAGGFFGLWWAFHDVEGGQVYLQLEEGVLCVKVHVPDEVRRREMRGLWSGRVVGTRGDLHLRRPQRFGNGKYMTVAVLDGEYRKRTPEGVLDLASTLRVLSCATAEVAAVVAAHTPR